jgi:hypothetical protein
VATILETDDRVASLRFFEWPFDLANTGIVQGWGFWLAVVGMLLTIGGFLITWKQLKLARTAAEAVKLEVSRIQVAVRGYDAAHHATRAATALDAARRHLRNTAWPDVADSYEDFRRAIITLQQLEIANLARFDPDIDAANKYISRLCERIETEHIQGAVSVDTAKTITMLRQHGELTGSIENALQKGLVA